ncbi:ribonuclease H-like domain-containing protein [Natrarchaeobius chitinivorans]|uniref:DNA-binding protein n=1 Tax=Natrarchaeobius chitinivorans TaxID=1679083 RepID=A0A3N6M1J6_NATCH|nr:ribonuclease H-like domain-containing protein [Natrarchaeobius chitinivorans]RQG97203.1 DNA-binding protein [Natrarchaeobius chitinivorans]
MTDARGANLLALGCDALDSTTERALEDLLEYADPDLVYVVRDGADVRVTSRLRRAFDGPVVDPDGPATCHTVSVSGVTFAFVDAIELLEDAIGEPKPSADGIDDGGRKRSAVSTDTGDDTEPFPTDVDYLVCDDLEPVTDRVTLEATLDGREAIARYQARSRGETVFCTGSLPASYDYVWRDVVDGVPIRLPVRGLGPIRRSGAAELARLTCDGAGSIAVSSVPGDRIGLGALAGVGPETADRLRDRGYDSRMHVAEAPIADLRSIDGIGESTARRIRRSARAIEESCVVRRTDESVPPVDGNPLFVDIETDGLQPTIVWLIGVYDPARDRYVDFVDTELSRSNPGTATRAFLEWLAAEYDDPELVAWNGYGFDFVHLERFVARYAPEYREFWAERVSTNDPYDWAIRRDHAVLPGRTNRLEEVAAALGYTRDIGVDAIDGRTLAKRIRRRLEGPDGTEPTEPHGGSGCATDREIDWENARKYCEADVRELAAVYDAIANAKPTAGTDGIGRATGDAERTAGGTSNRTADSTAQTGLGDFEP